MKLYTELDIASDRAKLWGLDSLALRQAILSALCTVFVIGIGWAGSLVIARELVSARWNRLMLLEAETKVRINQSADDWRVMHHGGRDDFVDTKEVRPVSMVVTGSRHIFYKSPNWPDSWTLKDLPFARFRAGDPDRTPPSDATDSSLGQRLPSILFDRTIDSQPWRFAMAGFENKVFVLGYAHTELFREPRFAEKLLLNSSLVLFLLIALIQWFVTRQSLVPLSKIIKTTKEISGTSLETRLDTDTSSRELDALTEVINAMLDRLAESFKLTRRFTADASHELKTPLAVLYSRLNRALQQAANEPDQKLFAELLGEVERLSATVEKLLLLSRADSGALQLKLEVIDLSEMVELLSDDIGHLDESVVVHSEIPRGIGIEGDYVLLKQVFYNLASNAVKYSVRENIVSINLGQDNQRVYVEISNPSETISEDDEKRMFERFYRFDPAHSREKEGAGLGLSLAKEIVLAHKGSMEFDSSKEGYAIFRVWLPSL